MAFRFIRRRMKHACASAAALALALAPIEASAYFVPRYQAPWPALTDSNSYTPGCSRAGFSNNAGTITNGYGTQLSQLFCTSPNYAIHNIRFMVDNFWVNSNGVNNPETNTGNTNTVDYLTALIGGTYYPVTFGGAIGIQINDGGFVWSDPLRDSSGNIVTIAANTQFEARLSRSVLNGQNREYGTGLASASSPFYSNSVGVPDYSISLTAPNFTDRTAGTLGGSSASISDGPLVFAQGWDGSAVYTIPGDSIGWGQNDTAYAIPSLSGYVARALADPASGARNFLSLAFPGTKPEDQSSIATGQYKLRMRALRSVGNVPFNTIISQMGQNSPTVGGSSLAAFQTVMTNWWQFWHDTCPSCRIFQTNFPSHAGSLNNTKWTTQADQTTDSPTSVRVLGSAWIAANVGLPSYVTGIDVRTALTTGSGYTDNPGNWPTGIWSGTLAAQPATGQKVVSVSAASAPAIGANFVIEPGVSNVESASIVNVAGASSPWTVSLNANISKTHLIGASVAEACTYEGTHPCTLLYQSAANALIALKNSGALP
jgi:hypothetical protein